MIEAFWRFKEYLAYAVAMLLGLLGLFITLVITLGATLHRDGGDGAALPLALGIGLGVLPMLVAFWLFRSVLKSSGRRRLEVAERKVLDLAARAGGRLTPMQVARATSLTLEESKSLLDRLGIEGHCQIELAADGIVSYRFRP